MADYNGSFSGSIEALDYSGLDVYSGSTFGFFLHQRLGTDVERVDVGDFYTTYLESDPFPIYSSPSGARDPGHYIIVRSGSDAIRVTPIRDFFGGYIERVDVNNRNTAFIYAKGVGRNTITGQETWGVKVLTINGETIYDYWNTPGNLQGLTLTILSGSNFEVISTTNYSTDSNTSEANNLATSINNMTPQQVGVITSLGYWEDKLTDSLRSASFSVGLSKLGAFNSTITGSAYAAIFTGASGSDGSRDAVERMSTVGVGVGAKDIPVVTLTTRLQSNKQGIYDFPIIDGGHGSNALYAHGQSGILPAVYVSSDNQLIFNAPISASVSSAESASYAVTASYALNGGGTGTGGIFIQTGSYYATTNDLQITGSLSVTEPITGSIESASYAATASLLLGSVESASYAATASYIDGVINFPSGLDVTGSITSTTSVSASSMQTGDGSGILGIVSSSYALSASYAANVGVSPGGSGIFTQTGSYYATTNDLQVTGSLSITEPITGSITQAISSSYAATASVLLGSVVSASYALTASYAANAGSPGGSGIFTQTGSYYATTNDLQVTGSLDMTGSFSATTKSFLIDHQIILGRKLKYGVVEAPEHSVVYRGRLIDQNVIHLPDEWEWLVNEDTITVQLTPYGKHQKLYVLNISNNTIHVEIEGNGQIDCYYHVQGTRKDVPPLETVI